jgi:hypothetical protein
VDLIRAWQDMYPSQLVSVYFLLLVIAVTFVQVVRVAWWAFRAARSTPGRPRDGADAARLSSRATLIARSTRGLARAAVWLTCAGGAASLTSAIVLIENSGEPGMSILVRNHLAVIEAIAIGLGLCVLPFAASLVFDLVAARMARQSPFPPGRSALDVDGVGDYRLLVFLRRGTPALGLIALVLVSLLLLNIRAIYVAAVGARPDPFFFSAAFDAFDYLWSRLSAILATVGVLTWLTTLLESARLRRRLPE